MEKTYSVTEDSIKKALENFEDPDLKQKMFDYLKTKVCQKVTAKEWNQHVFEDYKLYLAELPKEKSSETEKRYSYYNVICEVEKALCEESPPEQEKEILPESKNEIQKTADIHYFENGYWVPLDPEIKEDHHEKAYENWACSLCQFNKAKDGHFFKISLPKGKKLSCYQCINMDYAPFFLSEDSVKRIQAFQKSEKEKVDKSDDMFDLYEPKFFLKKQSNPVFDFLRPSIFEKMRDPNNNNYN